MFLSLENIALNMQTKLNTIASTLYTAETVANKVVFKVTANLQEYAKITEMEYATDDLIKYTPILVKQVFSTMREDFTKGMYEEGYICEVYGYYANKEDIELIFDKYTYDENATNWETISSWYIQKNTSRLKFVNNFTDTSGDNLERVLYSMDFRWLYVLGGINQSVTSLSIGGSVVEYIAINYTSDKIVIPNVTYGTNTTPIGATGFTLAVTLPAQNVTANKNLFTDLSTKTYNKSYAIVLTMPNFVNITHTMVLKSGTMNIERDQLISYTLVFEEALARTVVTIDGYTLPILSFNFERINNISPINTDEDVKYEIRESDYLINMRLGYIPNNTGSEALLEAILTSDYLSEDYTIVIGATGIASKTYTALLSNGKYMFEQTGELMYECTFVAKQVNI